MNRVEFWKRREIHKNAEVVSVWITQKQRKQKRKGERQKDEEKDKKRGGGGVTGEKGEKKKRGQI